MTPPTTTEILALRALDETVDERFVAWAVDRLARGEDSPSRAPVSGHSDSRES